jgi:glycine cleavage system H protein
MSAPRKSKPHRAERAIASGGSNAPHDDRTARPDALAWLPCVWMSAGLLAYKLCDREYECERCPLDAALGGAHSAASEQATIRGRLSHLDVRADRRYSRSHGWVQDVGGARVRCGVDALAGRLLDRVSTVVLPAVGSELQQGEPACWLVDESEPIAFLAPVSGTVVRTNERARGSPACVPASPYKDGWLFELDTAQSPARDDGLIDASEMRRRTADDLRRLRRHLARQGHHADAKVGPTLPDGGRRLAAPRELLGTARYHGLVRRLLR